MHPDSWDLASDMPKVSQLSLVVSKFGSVRFSPYFRTQNRILGSVQGPSPNPELDPRFSFERVQFSLIRWVNFEADYHNKAIMSILLG